MARSPEQPQASLYTGSGYYREIESLTAKAAGKETETSVQPLPRVPWLPSFSPVLLYGPFLVFLLIFVCAFILQVINKARDAKRVASALILALFFATAPLILTALRDGTRFESHAGPDEVPRNVIIMQVSDTAATITWKTSGEKIGAVRLGPAPLSEQTSTVIVADGGKKMNDHIARTESLSRGTVYEFEILSGGIWYSDQGKPLRFDIR